MPQLKQPRMQSPATANMNTSSSSTRVPIMGAPSIPNDRVDLIKMLMELGMGGMGGGMRGGMPKTPFPSNIPNQRIPNPQSISQPGMSGMSPLDTLKMLEGAPAWARDRLLGQ